MWALRFLSFAFLAFLAFLTACGGKSISMVGGEAGSGSTCEETQCGDDCVDTSSDPNHCGRCNRRCERDENCFDGRCVETSECPPPYTMCGDECVDLAFSDQHCGGCGFDCGFDGRCFDGRCISDCPNGSCGDFCVDFSNDPFNCGGCGFACGPNEYCSGGSCFNGCSGAICGGTCVDVTSDPYNCGGCGSLCIEPGFVCAGGSCQSLCPPELLYCNGACVDWRFDTSNCGGCGFQCAEGAACDFGSCIDSCPTGTYCGGECVNTFSDPNHCGGCFNVCDTVSRCIMGTCIGSGGTCGDRVIQPNEEGDPPPGSLMIAPLDPRTCRYDFSRINQWYCNGTCGNWGGADGCDQSDADAFCRLKMDNPRSTAVNFSVVFALPEPGVCCPPPTYAPGALGCTSLGVLSSRGVNLNVSIHPTSLFSTHQNGRVITNLVCTDP